MKHHDFDKNLEFISSKISAGIKLDKPKIE